MKLNPPFATDTVARVTSVPTCTNTRLALGTAAPVASCTTPVTPPLNCAKETLAEKAATRNTKKQRNPVVNLIQFPPTSILTNLARPEKRFPRPPRLSADDRPSRNDWALYQESKCKQLHHV